MSHSAAHATAAQKETRTSSCKSCAAGCELPGMGAQPPDRRGGAALRAAIQGTPWAHLTHLQSASGAPASQLW